MQFTDETAGSGEPQMTLVQDSSEATCHKTVRQSKPTQSDLESEEQQKGLNKIQRNVAKLKSVVEKVEQPAVPESPSERKDWERSQKEHFAAHNEEKARCIEKGHWDYAKYQEEKQMKETENTTT